VGPRARYLPLVAVLGAVLGGLPAFATSAGSTPTINGLESKMWSPSEVTIGPGGSVIFKNASTTLAHSVKWMSGPGKPACTGVPESGETHWEGSCTFAAAGTYKFFCTVHPFMTGTVQVSASGTTTVTTTGGTGTTTAPATTGPAGHPEGTPGALSGGSGSPGATPGGGSAPGGGAHLSLAGSALASVQHGRTVHGTVLVSGGGARLEVELRAPAGQVSRGGSPVTIGNLVRTGLHAGRVGFAVALDGRARRALRRHGRLRLQVRLTLSAPGVTSAHRTIAVLLRGA